MIDRLTAWVADNGGRVGPLAITGAAGARAAFAAEPLAEGVRLLDLPRACLFTQEAAASTPSGAFVAERWRGAARAQVVLAAGLASLRRAPPPFWAPWVDTLPTALPTNPLFFDAADLANLAGTSVDLLLPARRERLREEYAALRSGVPGLDGLTEHEWRLARTLVNSRAFHVDDAVGDALVALADLLDHAPNPESTWAFDEGRFKLSAACDVPAGAPVRDGYGPKSDARLLLHYGFTVADNPVRAVWLDFGELGPAALPDDATTRTAHEVLEALGATSDDLGERRAGWERLRAVCVARLAQLPDAPLPDTPNGRNAARVRAVDRDVLVGWVERAANALANENGARP